MEEIIERVSLKALRNDFYVGCSQSVLQALQEEFNIGNLESFKSATVLSGGVARFGETCGALIGALLALGLVVGREQMEDTEQYRRALVPALEIHERFREEVAREFGLPDKLNTTICRCIQRIVLGRSFVLNDPQDYQAFLKAGGHTEKGCPRVCGIGARVGAEKLLEIRSKQY